MTDLKNYLSGLTYGTAGTKQLFGYDNTFGVDVKNSKEPQDEIAKFKAEIRSVKGTLLSSRRFPPGGVNGVLAR